jgi:hypothetical protein
VLDHARQLGQAQDAGPGQVADVRDTDHRQQMVLAEGPDGDAPGEDEFFSELTRAPRDQVTG